MARYPVMMRFMVNNEMKNEIERKAKENELSVSVYLRWKVKSA
jgi:hypothetical protein